MITCVLVLVFAVLAERIAAIALYSPEAAVLTGVYVVALSKFVSHPRTLS